ncbi:MAG: HlyC/CorC family transporter [Deltaproteobacteria bacterium]|nr:HlyC/CorC family transporter [Deltaproteobacteria bacterium]
MDSPELGVALLGLLAVFALLLTNAYFVATEFALVAVRRTQMQLWVEEGRRGAKAAAAAIRDLDDAIAATQLGITIASIGLGFVGEPALAHLIEPALVAVSLGSAAVLHTVSLVVSFSIVTFLHVVVGELAPKALALDRPGRVALVCARPLLLFARAFHPIIAAMNGAGNALVSLLGVEPVGHRELVHSPEELSLLVDEARDAGQIRPYAGRILGNVFRLSKTRVCDVMVPRERVFAVHRRAQPEELLDILREEGYTRIPVYDRDLDDVVGILHAKDIFHIAADNRLVILEDALRPVLEIRPDLPVVDALRRFRSGRRHLALVRERGGPLLGVCTLEDVLEEIVGEIEDEHDEPTPAGGE